MDGENNAIFIGKVLKEYDILDSTNLECERLLKEKKWPEGTVIIAKEQFAGRGQRGNTWESKPFSNLTVSYILYPKLQFPQEQFLLIQMVSLGIKDFLSHLTLKNVTIKWPNDIMVNDKKIAGILIQNSISRNQFNYSIVGIGLNVNQTVFPDNIGNPTSLENEGVVNNDLNSVLNTLSFFIEKRYMQLKSRKHEKIEEDYLFSLYRKNIKSSFKDMNNYFFEGKIIDVNEKGQLRILVEEKIKEYNFKEISFV